MSDTVQSRIENLHPITDLILNRQAKEKKLQQRAKVIWLYGISGSGKSTLANALERRLFKEGFSTTLLDGDNIRTGINAGLGFSDEDRIENNRRVAEVSKLFADSGIITINSFITPLNSLRELIKEILGADLIQVHISCSYKKSEERDVKGLYAKAKSGKIKNFTGKDSSFEDPSSDKPADLVINTEKETLEQSLETLYNYVIKQISYP
ncbi:MAG: adenylyl-sulfate kinase [Verrucomicrobiota bacterium]